MIDYRSLNIELMIGLKTEIQGLIDGLNKLIQSGDYNDSVSELVGEIEGLNRAVELVDKMIDIYPS